MIASATQDWRAKRLIERQARYRAGLWAEVFAAIALMLKGYRILARRRKTRSGEIDLIAVRGTKLAFVEVKARPSLEAAEASISDLQARRIRAASEQWLARSPRYQNHERRFDALYVLPWRWPIHRPDGA
jgi:putative endonuclease